MRTLIIAIFAIFAFAAPAMAQQSLQPMHSPCPPNASRCHVEYNESVRITNDRYRGSHQRYDREIAIAAIILELTRRYGGHTQNYNPGYVQQIPQQRGYTAQASLVCQPGEQPTFDNRGVVVACTGYRVSGPQCLDRNFPRPAVHPVTGQAICVR